MKLGCTRLIRDRFAAMSARLDPMAFGQQSGPPASAKQLQELLALLQAAGHSGFRDARGPLGFTQRQGGGKFTRDEAAELIESLSQAADSGGDTLDSPVQVAAAGGSQRLSTTEQALRKLPAERLAAELQRRGWIVVEP